MSEAQSSEWRIDAPDSVIADFWRVYEENFDPMNDAVLVAVEKIPAFGRVLASQDEAQQEQQREYSRGLMRAALLDGVWEPYVEYLRIQGRTYARMGIAFVDWYALLTPYRSVLVPRVLESYGSDPDRAEAVLQVLGQHLDVAMATIGEAYIDEERDKLRSKTKEVEAHAAELERRNVDLQEFAYVASHDLQEPLRQISMFSEMLTRELGDELEGKQEKYLSYVNDGAGRMRALIKDLLSYSKTDTAELGSELVSLREIVERVLADLAQAVSDADASIEGVDALARVEGDRTLLARIMQNLIENALKFRAPDRPCVVQLRQVAQEGEWRIEVADNGIGVDPLHQDQVFRLFSRLAPREYAGTGIGLALVRKCVTRHGGRIWVETPDAGGARFVFTLPRP